jgi:hypothetical protein
MTSPSTPKASKTPRNVLLPHRRRNRRQQRHRLRSAPPLPLPCSSADPAGEAIVRQLALQYPKSPLNAGPLLIYLTARDPTRGRDAVAALQRDPALLAARALRSDGGLSEIKFAQLDISDSKSIGAFAEFLKEEHPAGIDIGPCPSRSTRRTSGSDGGQ